MLRLETEPCDLGWASGAKRHRRRTVASGVSIDSGGDDMNMGRREERGSIGTESGTSMGGDRAVGDTRRENSVGLGGGGIGQTSMC